MLRLKKLKAKAASEEAVGPSAATVSVGSCDEAAMTNIMDNMPRSISVRNNARLASSNSSVSLNGPHVVPPLSRCKDDETTVSHGLAVPCQSSGHLTNLDESRSAVCTNVKMKTSSKQKKRTHEVFLRKVSDSDLSGRVDDTLSGSETAPVQKKARTSSLSLPEINLLANPEDATVLNPLHVFVRKHIEVFTATPTDMAQPAPGRKNPIKLHQVGLRCVHCRGLPSRDRVKRAVCYPSSVGRVYNSVSDMKFDHFTNCRGLSRDLRDEFETLKAQGKRRGDSKKGSVERSSSGSSSTAQYYHDSARKMGMVDAGSGIFMAENTEIQQPSSPPRSSKPVDCQRVALASASPLRTPLFDASKQLARELSLQRSVLAMYQQDRRFAAAAAFTKRHSKAPSPLVHPLLNVRSSSDLAGLALPMPSIPRSHSVLLASPLDQQFLNPIHCFVRRNIEAFIATKEDTAAPAPGRKNRVVLGQVGVRCVHCARLPIGDRVKRSVCYPPSVSGIYHSVSNMKFDHFGKCRGLPAEARAEFATLRASGSRRTGASRGAMSNSTAQYYHDSALRLGLVDTEKGIRFRKQRLASEQPKQANSSSPIPDGFSALMLAATTARIRGEFDRKRECFANV